MWKGRRGVPHHGVGVRELMKGARQFGLFGPWTLCERWGIGRRPSQAPSALMFPTYAAAVVMQLRPRGRAGMSRGGAAGSDPRHVPSRPRGHAPCGRAACFRWEFTAKELWEHFRHPWSLLIFTGEGRVFSGRPHTPGGAGVRVVSVRGCPPTQTVNASTLTQKRGRGCLVCQCNGLYRPG